MVWTKYQIVLAVLLVSTGTFNTLSIKWADKTRAVGADKILKEFRHPFFQAWIMFGGEIACLVTFRILIYHYKVKDNSHDIRTLTKGCRVFNAWIFFLPAVFDVISTSLMFLGLTLTYASSFQMLRGSVIIFVAVLSVGFLNRKIVSRQWIGIFIVLLGLLIVGFSDFLFGETENVSGREVVIGDLLIVFAQIATAVQVVLEDHFVKDVDIPPLHAVGLEGCFGFGIMGVVLVPMYYIRVDKEISTNPEGKLEDLNDAFTQMESNPMILLPLLGCAISIAFFNFAGIAVTKEMSGTTRTVLDTIRTLFVWAVSIILGWQSFFVFQIIGFVILAIGILVYNDIILPGLILKFWKALMGFRRRHQAEPQEPLVPSTTRSANEADSLRGSDKGSEKNHRKFSKNNQPL